MHYFIDYTNLTQQDSTDAFGVDSIDPINKFNISSCFQLTSEAKVHACQAGMMIIQQSDVDSTLVNVLIYPMDSLKVIFSNIEYFIYRGILKSSLFIDDGTIVAKDPSNNEFIARFWENQENYKIESDQPDLEDPAPNVMGFNSSLDGTLDVEEILTGAQADAKPIYVRQGEWFGEFTNSHKISFEVIKKNHNLIVDLDYLRKEKHQIEIIGLTGLELRSKKEEILSFIDPAAFFGLHHAVGISVSTYPSDVKTTEKKTTDDLYNLLISPFATKNRVYLDIRSEFGYSYNFYQNYDDDTGSNIKIGNSQNPVIEMNYSYSGWPIFYLTTPINTPESYNDILLHLRIDDNIQPLLYAENSDVLSNNSGSNLLDDTKLIDSPSSSWSKQIELKFPNIDDGITKNNVAHYLKLQYFRQQHNPSSPTTVLKQEAYYQSILPPINLPDIGEADTTLKHLFNPSLQLIKGSYPTPSDQFSYLATNGVNWDDNKIIFYAKVLYPITNSGQQITPLPSFAEDPGFDIEGDFAQTSFLKNDMSILSNRITDPGVGNVKILETIHHMATIFYKENQLLLCLTIAEFDSIKNVSGLSDFHDKYFHLEEVTDSPFTSGIVNYRKYELKVQGLAANGDALIVSPASPIFIYSKDGFTFNSASYGDLEAIDNKAKTSEIYGGFRVFQWTGYINEPREANVIQIMEDTCISIPSIFPTMLYTIAMGEGLNLWIDANYDPNPPHNVMIGNTIDGIDDLGTDDFGSEFSRYSSFLPPGFNVGVHFFPYDTVNELEPTVSASYINLESGIIAIGAVIAHRRQTFLNDAKEFGYFEPNIDQLFYWIYVYYQGEGRAKTYLEHNNGFDFTKEILPIVKQETGFNMNVIKSKALDRLASWRYLTVNNFFSS